MIKISAVNDTSGADVLFKLFDGFEQDVPQLADETFTELQPEHLAEFQRQPRVRSYPGDYPGGLLPFDTEKQRRWYWANIGKPHVRTGKLAASLKQVVNRGPQKVEVTAEYGGTATKYVLGNIQGEEIKAYQQRFHKATGWQLAAPLLVRHAENYYARFVRRFEAYIAFYR